MSIAIITGFIKRNLAFFIGLLIVFIIAPITFHGDFYVLSKVSEVIANGNLSIYHKITIENGLTILNPIMPPLIFLADGLLFFLFKSLHIINFSFDSALQAGGGYAYFFTYPSIKKPLYFTIYPLISFCKENCVPL